jgi:hypothetical protein
MANNKRKDERIVVHVYAELKNLIPGYLEGIHGNIRSILTALKKCNYKTIEALGHSMRGSGGGYGFETITNIGGTIEQAAIDRNPKQIEKCLSELRNYLERVKVLYE